VAPPGQLRLIFRSKRKNDRVDAAKVAKLLCLDAVPQVHVPGAGVRAWRGLFAHRQTLVGRRVAVKNQVRALLRSHAIAMPAGKRLWSGKGLAWLKAQELAAAADDALRRDLMAEELAGLTTRLARVDKERAARADAHPAVAVLTTIPGVGARTAEAPAAHLDDVRRFRRSKQVGAYLGLVPCQDASAGRERLGHIAGDGPAVVRKLLCEAAWQGVRRSPTLRAYLERLQRAGTRTARRSPWSRPPGTWRAWPRRCCGRARHGERRSSGRPPPPKLAATGPPLRKTPEP
jgi:transposase